MAPTSVGREQQSFECDVSKGQRYKMSWYTETDPADLEKALDEAMEVMTELKTNENSVGSPEPMIQPKS